ncbi:UNVERIFIED_CONTAM: hypothetical protein GTU68_064465 [Idotea baltica]|nr:hypothetical protein [Idotea baltica]
MKRNSRRVFLKTSVIGGVISSATLAWGDVLKKLKSTPPEIEGPFYPVTPQKDKDFDLTQIDGHTEVAAGQVILIEGSVVDTTGTPVEDASVELWQANAAGRYSHPHDQNTAPLDPGFQGWAIVPSGKEGKFRFKTVMPGSYPASRNWSRPPHIHFKVSKLGYVELITQMYFPGNPLNDKDLLLQRKSEHEQELMIASKAINNSERFSFRIVLLKA